MKYACVIQTWCEARLIASRYIARIGNIHSRGTLRCTRMCGSQSATVSSSKGRVPWRRRRFRFQKSANARLRSQTPGPVIRTCVSRHSVA